MSSDGWSDDDEGTQQAQVTPDARPATSRSQATDGHQQPTAGSTPISRSGAYLQTVQKLSPLELYDALAAKLVSQAEQMNSTLPQELGKVVAQYNEQSKKQHATKKRILRPVTSTQPTAEGSQIEGRYETQAPGGVAAAVVGKQPAHLSGATWGDLLNPLHHQVSHNATLELPQRPTDLQRFSTPMLCAGRDLIATSADSSINVVAAYLPALLSALASSRQTSHQEIADRTKGTRNDRVAPWVSIRRGVYPRALLMVQTRERAIEAYTLAIKLAFRTGVRCVVVFGGAEDKQPLSRVLGGGCDMLVATARALEKWLGRGIVNAAQIVWLVIDEAEQVLTDEKCAHTFASMVKQGSGDTSVRPQVAVFQSTEGATDATLRVARGVTNDACELQASSILGVQLSQCAHKAKDSQRTEPTGPAPENRGPVHTLRPQLHVDAATARSGTGDSPPQTQNNKASNVGAAIEQAASVSGLHEGTIANVETMDTQMPNNTATTEGGLYPGFGHRNKGGGDDSRGTSGLSDRRGRWSQGVGNQRGSTLRLGGRYNRYYDWDRGNKNALGGSQSYLHGRSYHHGHQLGDAERWDSWPRGRQWQRHRPFGRRRGRGRGFARGRSESHIQPDSSVGQQQQQQQQQSDDWTASEDEV